MVTNQHVGLLGNNHIIKKENQMKTKFFTLMLMLVSVFAVQAQNLTNKLWVTDISTPDNANMALVLYFADNGECEMSIIAKKTENLDGIKMIMNMVVAVPGTYTLVDNNLNTNFNREKADFNIDLDFEGVDESTKSLMKNMMAAELSEHKSTILTEIIKDIPDLSGMKISKLTDKNLVIADEKGEEQTFEVLPD